ncbi:MAG TPA: DNA polymerase III subunit [Actinomycetota bacterium]|nr:DNA polymerase III subunit [Actinomycetota bacterium]
MAVLDQVEGQDVAVAFLRGAAVRPHHAYVFAGPEGSGKSLAARAFAASLLCHDGGCGTCRDCRLALADHHPNEFVVEPEGRDIHVDTVRDEIWQPAYRTAPEPGRKVFLIREADRLSPAAADTLLKVLEEPPPDTVFVLSSARADELPDTIVSRCHVVSFAALSEPFVIAQLRSEGVDEIRAALAARLSGGNLGRARRMATAPDGLAFRTVAIDALAAADEGAAGALRAAELVTAAAADYRKGLTAELDEELAPFLDEKGRPEDAYRGAIRRIETRFARRSKRAERDHVDRVLLAAGALLRDRAANAVGADPADLMNPDLAEEPRQDLAASIADLAALEQARADLADDVNLNARLALERAFLRLATIGG